MCKRNNCGFRKEPSDTVAHEAVSTQTYANTTHTSDNNSAFRENADYENWKETTTSDYEVPDETATSHYEIPNEMTTPHYENIENSIHVVLVQTDVVLTDEALNIIAGIFHLSHVGPPLSVRSLKNKYRKAKRNKTVF